MADYDVLSGIQAAGLNFKKAVTGGRELLCDCPICGKKAHLSINKTTGAAYCLKCGYEGSVVSLYALSHGLPYSTKAEKRAVFKELVSGRSNPVVAPKKVFEEPPKECPLAPIEVRDKAYRILMDHMTLDDIDREELIRRGFSDLTSYRSTPKSTPELVKPVLEAGIDPTGIPGFYKKHGQWTFTQMRKGILIPVKDAYDRIEGFQVRVREASDNKYRWVSSSVMDHGTGAKTFVHFACERSDIGGTMIPTVRNTAAGRAFILTEGPLKADAIHHLSGADVIAIPGVNAQKQLKGALLLLKKRGVEIIYDGFDMDYITNETVEKASRTIRKMIEDLGMSYTRLTWDASYKGLDDYFLAKTKNRSLQGSFPTSGHSALCALPRRRGLVWKK